MESVGQVICHLVLIGVSAQELSVWGEFLGRTKYLLVSKNIAG
jgi:hypothetical protein